MRVATLNIWGYNGPWRDRLALIRAELERVRPDLLALQEVNTRDGVCQAEEIADGLGYAVAFGPALQREDGSSYGNALLSRVPILAQRVHQLPVLDVEPRALLSAVVQTEHGTLPVFVTHLDWELDRGYARLAQVRHIVATIEHAGAGLPPLLMGDFNAEPDSDEIRYLRGLAVVEGTSAHFADAWTQAGDGTAGTTFDRRNDYARAAREPSRRLDYIFTRGEPLRAELAFATPTEIDGVTVWPSDHFGLVADLSLS